MVQRQQLAQEEMDNSTDISESEMAVLLQVLRALGSES